MTKKINSGYRFDYHIIGIFEDKKINHMDRIVDNDIRQNIKTSIKDGDSTGEIGNHQIFYNNKNKIIVFGLGNKEKLSPISLNKAISHTINKVGNTNNTNILFNLDNISLGTDESTIKSIIISLEK